MKRDEIDTPLECRCVAPNEAAWRLLQFIVHYTDPSVEMFHVHMPFDNNIMFTEDDNLEQVLENPMNCITKLTAWFVANREYAEAAPYTYVEFPEYFTWHADGKYWAKEKSLQKNWANSTCWSSPRRCLLPSNVATHYQRCKIICQCSNN